MAGGDVRLSGIQLEIAALDARLRAMERDAMVAMYASAAIGAVVAMLAGWVRL